MVFATADLDKAARLLERRAVPGERQRAGERLVLSREATHGVPIELCDAPGARFALAARRLG